jgi:aldehyde:ferredoxin oxidoreductase
VKGQCGPLLGTNLDLPDLKRVSEWNHLADDLGMDTISLGAVIGFAMELQERGLLDAGVRFGDPSGVTDLIKDIAYRRGVGAELADGVRRMSEKYGGRAFAMHVKGLELSAYDPRGSYAQGVEYATTNRGGCHVQGANYKIDQPATINRRASTSRPTPWSCRVSRAPSTRWCSYLTT